MRGVGRTRPPTDLTPRVSLFIILICGLALCATYGTFLLSGVPRDLGDLLVLFVLALASLTGRNNDVGARIGFSFISIVVLAAIAICGPMGAALIGITANLLRPLRMPWRVRTYNSAMFGCIGALGGMVYLVAGGAFPIGGLQGPGPLLLSVGLPIMVADVVQCLANALLLAAIQRVVNGVPMRAQMRKLLGVTGFAYVGYGVIGFLFVVLWIPAEVGAFSALLVLAPLFVARWAFVQYGDELRAHERTLRALVTAVETKEPHNVGHSERVAQLSEWVAEVLGLGHKEIQDVRTAGMLHDVGKVGVPTRLLRARRPLGDDDLVVIAEHALGGVELVEGIDFLSGSVPGIAHHHERFDGRGYPAGLAGEAIPLPARIVAAADVFDCLTSTRAYRDALSTQEALAVLTERAGTQFDVQVVEALTKALARHEWTPTERTAELLASAGVALDHDEPEVSDLLAGRPDLRGRIRGARARVRVPVKELS